MDQNSYIAIGLEVILILASIVFLIWLIIRRNRLKKEETFEKRDN